MRLWAKGIGVRIAVVVFSVAFASPAEADTRDRLTPAAFSAELVVLQHLAQACAGDVAACDAAKSPPAQQVGDDSGAGFAISWDWLRESLSSAKSATPSDRAKAMQQVQVHLAELARQAGAGNKTFVAAKDFQGARAAADAALRRAEFRAVDGPSWMDRQLAKLQDAILRLFTGMGRLGEHAPWLAPLIEWSCFGLAAAGLLWSVRQSLTRQSLRLSLSEGGALAQFGERDTADWARRAEERAAAEDWREAVHCLYWAAISLLEARRAWKANATRTPREYVRLLQPGSTAQRALRELTRIFERVWYGYAEATESQYRAARDSFDVLEATKTERRQSSEAVSSLATAGNAQ